MVRQSVLVVEDEDDIRELVSYNLLKAGYQVAGVGSGAEALDLVRSRPIDMVILDLMLPDLDGLTVCRQLKGDPKTASIPIVILTAKGEEPDVVSGLNVGADDYVTKPFSPKVLLARIDAVFRRVASVRSGEFDAKDPGATIRIHGLEIHPTRHQVLFRGERIELTATEFRLLQILAARPGWVFSRQQILGLVHGEDHVSTDRAVDVQIAGLRKKLGPAECYIETVRGVGYRFRESLAPDR